MTITITGRHALACPNMQIIKIQTHGQSGFSQCSCNQQHKEDCNRTKWSFTYLCRAAVDIDNIYISGGDTVTNGDMKMMYCLSEQVIND